MHIVQTSKKSVLEPSSGTEVFRPFCLLSMLSPVSMRPQVQEQRSPGFVAYRVFGVQGLGFGFSRV